MRRMMAGCLAVTAALYWGYVYFDTEPNIFHFLSSNEMSEMIIRAPHFIAQSLVYFLTVTALLTCAIYFFKYNGRKRTTLLGLSALQLAITHLCSLFSGVATWHVWVFLGIAPLHIIFDVISTIGFFLLMLIYFDKITIMKKVDLKSAFPAIMLVATLIPHVFFLIIPCVGVFFELSRAFFFPMFGWLQHIIPLILFAFYKEATVGRG